MPSAARQVGFKPHLRVEVVGGEAVYLLSERGTTALHGPHVEALAPLLDGTRTLEAVFLEAAGVVDAPAAGRTIAALAEAELIGYRAPSTDAAAEAYWELAGLSGAGAQAALGSTPVQVLVLGRTDPGPVHQECRASGLTLADEETSAAFTLVVCDDYLDPALADVDARHRAEGRPWLLARPWRRGLGGSGVRHPRAGLLVLPGTPAARTPRHAGAGPASARTAGTGAAAARLPGVRTGAGTAERRPGGDEVGRRDAP